MKLKMQKLSRKTVLEIDPISSKVNPKFAPMIFVTAPHPSREGETTKPIVTSLYAGQMTAWDAGAYSEALMIASFFCQQVNEGADLEGVYRAMARAQQSAKAAVNAHGKQFATIH